MTAAKYLDVGLVIATAPFVAIAGLPLVGYLFGAVAWVLTRAMAELLDRRAASHGANLSQRLGMHFAGIMTRVWIVVLAVVAARFAGDREDGIMAAVLVLAAFTVYLCMSALTRQIERNALRT